MGGGPGAHVPERPRRGRPVRRPDTVQETVTAAADHHGPDRPVVLWLGGLSADRYTETELVPLAPTPPKGCGS